MNLRVEARVVRGDVTVDAEFEARPGITVFFGPSGVGKSTTLAAVAGLLRPASGRITLGEQTWFDGAAGVDRPVHTRRLGFVFQSLALFPHLDGLSNVLYGMDEPSLDATRVRARETLERLGVGHLAARRPPTYSGGEAQRVALARVFARDPALLLLDEPFSALDRDLRRELGAEVRRYVDERRIPALFVTHHRREAKHLGDAVVAFDRSRTARQSTFDAIDDD